ncbi:alkanesulfonate monooxygenase SsuD/methylene tetrahydromethanopterin reductase-like flavin-dependent oxidoreductase (luciferase family) [Allocatelliglobosispora scoriae]|uniref:Alkanesulfonate monooxygenase SsuD/methylene tetrahydromethanopterin reductase-like flavin-dependent oxidoreductase (Luciferase family) n=1 Tax=Allocatelliglobosispora scoriae TaxID=643052 RepID=A0A841C011_9ACTN|nr:LLM class flavin-dependent oxidoreductase [Allocatelliglobosispora scoriae]MBB5872689.1 alkanesulfonate monooxygenase SsuD/methylene tetrahydromethanopterin reductase-like flavin-dependent oxidoreductase (luciferase family) [Allocatelliglobosispora scoriae]
MTDYGHELLFGTFLTPSAADPTAVVALAQVSEAAGLDLVSVQDHPYQPAFLDAWTLLSVIAAATDRVRVFPNVANLPLRPPTLLARSAASLDLLSGGRVELGLGTGAFWEAIVANGGPHREPGAAVDALEEAIAVIRAIWAGGRSVRVEGEHYRVVGAKAGPAPAHEIGIWLGAYKPRMLRVTGRLADGWLPSLGYAGLDALPAMNRTIDDAAEKAGRSPAAIRRLYNINGRFGRSGDFLQGSAADWAEQLTALTLAEGISGYILASDNPTDIQRFGEEVAPRVREMTTTHRVRPPAPRDTRAPVVVTEGGATGPGAAGQGVPASDVTGLGVVATPDDGTRLSEARLWDESARPTGPAPDADRVYTARERAGSRQLVDVHDHLRTELLQIRDLVEQVATGGLDVGSARSAINTMTLRQNNWTLGVYCESYCRVVTTHHTIEDTSLFPRLRRADARLAPVVDRLQEEHEIIHGVIEDVDQALVALVSGEGDISDLRAVVDLLSDTLLSHLSYEERELLEPLARLRVL